MKASEMSNEELADFIQWFGAPVGSLALDEAITRLRTMIPVPQAQVRSVTRFDEPWWSVCVGGCEIATVNTYETADDMRCKVKAALTPNTKEAQ